MAFVFTSIGSIADYGNYGRWLLFFVTVVCWAAQFANIALTSTHSVLIAHVIAF